HRARPRDRAWPLLPRPLQPASRRGDDRRRPAGRGARPRPPLQRYSPDSARGPAPAAAGGGTAVAGLRNRRVSRLSALLVGSAVVWGGLAAAEPTVVTSCKAVQAASPPNAIQLACVTDCSHPPDPLTPEQRAGLDSQLAANIDQIRLGFWHQACDGTQHKN